MQAHVGFAGTPIAFERAFADRRGQRFPCHAMKALLDLRTTPSRYGLTLLHICVMAKAATRREVPRGEVRAHGMRARLSAVSSHTPT